MMQRYDAFLTILVKNIKHPIIYKITELSHKIYIFVEMKIESI